jgi:chorismate mutase/prephenate dehydratase
MKIGYQGTIGSFSQIASLNLFPNEELINHISFREVVEGVSSGYLDFGVLPIENSYTGEVGMVLDELFKSNIYISGVYDLPIVQNLVGIKGAKLHEIKRVYSHEQALMQCSKVLGELGVETVSFTNTALASQYVKELNDPTKAAIASDLAVKVNGLEILLPSINDNPNNTTRFAIISKELKEIKGNFAFMFTVKDGSGALARVLNEISKLDVNLTAISSRTTHTAWKYYFYCEAEGRLDDPNIMKLREVLSLKCETFKIIGSY